MKKKLLLLFIFLFAVDVISAQYIIKGKVMDGGGEPLIGASVVVVDSTSIGQVTDFDGLFELEIPTLKGSIEVTYTGYSTSIVAIEDKFLEIYLHESENLSEVVVTGYSRSSKSSNNYNDYNSEAYAQIEENGYKKAKKSPLSTFSIDVDNAAYSNVRRFLNNDYMPDKYAVRIEEMINYFDYDYINPEGDIPFSINTELSSCPWNSKNMLLHLGVQGKELEMEDLPPSNIVFLLDVSGSMTDDNKLPLLKKSLKLLLNKLSERDKVAIVVYAGNSGLVLPSTKCSDKKTIIEALEKLQAGGSTAGGEGLKLAYKVAQENFIKGGNNRIILATDGDFNLGQSSNSEMEDLIVKEREKGVFISVLGYGMGNLKDDKLEIIANKGNGNYAYIDNILEAKKVLVKEFGGTLFTIAKDVKIQLEFNPAVVNKYRLVGYENRVMDAEEFEDDEKDAGELGSGHTVTVLYEIVPNKKYRIRSDLRYQTSQLSDVAKLKKEIATVKLRYKEPDGDKSKLVEDIIYNNPLPLDDTSNNFRFSAAVSEFGMLLRRSKYRGESKWQSAIKLAKSAKGEDAEGYRSEMIQLIEKAEIIAD